MLRFAAVLLSLALAAPAMAQDRTLRIVLGALFAPAKTPRELIDRYARAAIEAIRSPEMKARLENMGLEPTGLGPPELAAILRADYDKWGPVIRASGFKPTQ